MKYIKSYFITLFILILLIFTVGCRGTEHQKSIYYDDKKVASEGDSYTFLVRNGAVQDNKTSIKFSSFTGMETIYIIEAASNSKLKIDFNSKVLKGKFKVVFIDTNNKITKILEGTQEGSMELDLLKGRSRIKLVGKDTSGEVRIVLYPSNNIDIIEKNQ